MRTREDWPEYPDREVEAVGGRAREDALTDLATGGARCRGPWRASAAGKGVGWAVHRGAVPAGYACAQRALLHVAPPKTSPLAGSELWKHVASCGTSRRPDPESVTVRVSTGAQG